MTLLVCCCLYTAPNIEDLINQVFSSFDSKKMNGILQKWMVVFMLIILLKTESIKVDITYLQSAVAKGAVCLDGSPPAYHFDKGVGVGIDNWLVHMEGGAWCNNVTSCLARKSTPLGSSTLMLKQMTFSGIFSSQSKYNPDFYNWNRIRIRYCDGASFTGDIEAVDRTTKLYYRGARIFDAVMEDLLAKGMKKAKTAILSGCSSGGLASILHCDNFASRFNVGARVKCISDAGFFINAKDLTNAPRIQTFYNDVVNTHGSAKNLLQSCTSKMNAGLCFFPQNIIQQIKTPLFVVNAAYDSWQIKNTVAPGAADPHGAWHDCKADIEKCSASQLQTLQDFHNQFISLSTKVLNASPSNGYFINSCYSHCQTGTQETWLRSDSPVLNNTKIAEAVGNWFYNRSPFKKIDCPFPCDKTCHNRVFDSNEQPLI